jgi:hypothetical protein
MAVGTNKTSRRKTARRPARRALRPARDEQAVAIHVSRAALLDISRRLQLAASTGAACHAGLLAQNVDASADIAVTLQWSVIDVIRRQSSRLEVIAGAHVEKDQVVAVVSR